MTSFIHPESEQLYVKVGKELKRLRTTKANMSLLAYSKEIGLSRSAYNKIEKGTGDYYLSSLQRAVSYYPDVSLEKLFQKAGI